VDSSNLQCTGLKIEQLFLAIFSGTLCIPSFISVTGSLDLQLLTYDTINSTHKPVQIFFSSSATRNATYEPECLQTFANQVAVTKGNA
jgi:hypothetical protein